MRAPSSRKITRVRRRSHLALRAAGTEGPGRELSRSAPEPLQGMDCAWPA